MTTDLSTLPLPSEAAEIAAQCYVGPWKWVVGDVHVTDTKWGDYRVIGFRGTCRNNADILRDVRFMPWWSPRVGFCPAGFYKGVRNVIDAINLDCAEDIKAGRLAIVGHSLGGSLSLILAGWLTALGYPPAAVYAFEPARCGGRKLRKLLRTVHSFASIDGNDPIPSVPLFYEIPVPTTYIGIKQFDIFACHRIAQVIEDLKAANL